MGGLNYAEYCILYYSVDHECTYIVLLYSTCACLASGRVKVERAGLVLK